MLVISKTQRFPNPDFSPGMLEVVRKMGASVYLFIHLFTHIYLFRDRAIFISTVSEYGMEDRASISSRAESHFNLVPSSNTD